MATTRGRKPLAVGHVARLTGSQWAKRQMEVLLETLSGKLTVHQACGLLGIGQSRFHVIRHRWLQQALKLLEPRPVGRPPKPKAQADAPCAQLERMLQTAQQAAHGARLRHTVDQILSQDGVAKKKAGPLRSARASGRAGRYGQHGSDRGT